MSHKSQICQVENLFISSCYSHCLYRILDSKKNQPLLIYCSRPSRDSQEPKTTKKFQFSRWLFQKITFLYFFLHKSWIWRTLRHDMNIFSKWHFLNAPKEYFWSKKISNFMHRFKSAILEIFQFFQNGTFLFFVTNERFL